MATCKDCIHLKACIHLLETAYPKYKGMNIEFNTTCEEFKDKADYQEMKHGYWKDRFGNKYDNHLYECSVCGEKALYEHYIDELRSSKSRQALTIGCPHCLAIMDAKEEE